MNIELMYTLVNGKEPIASIRNILDSHSQTTRSHIFGIYLFNKCLSIAILNGGSSYV